MSTPDLKQKIQDDMKTAMRAQDSVRLGTIRMLLAAIKQIEIDTRVSLDKAGILGVIHKMIKQRLDSAEQFEKAHRPELAAKERTEVVILEAYLPQQLSPHEIEAAVQSALERTAAASIRDMGKVMAVLKSELAGAVDMAKVSEIVKQKLSE